MLSFYHHQQSILLQGGELWASKPSMESYRDTAADGVRSIIRQIEQGTPWRRAVAERYADSNPWLYSIVTSECRPLFFRQQPMVPGSSILDIGAGWGQIALPLAREQGATVTALEPTSERLDFIRAAATQEGLSASMHYIQADFMDLKFAEIFDMICCVGVLEWIPQFRMGDPLDLQIAFLRQAREALREGGRLVIGIENRLGLKYLLGAPDDHIGTANITVYDAALANEKWRRHSGQDLRCYTRTQAELQSMLAQAGFRKNDFYAALPDYKLPQKIIALDETRSLDEFFLTDNFIPEHNGSNGQPLDFQPELKSHYHSLARLGISHAFAPSYFIIAS